jgi:type IV pilus assembly protein PilA
MDDRQHGFTLLELMIVVAIILTLLAIAVPHLLHSKMSANEAVARESLHVLNFALFQYWTIYRTYPAALVNLAAGAQIDETSADLIDPVLASGRKSGYSFVYAPAQVDLDGVVSAYNITAMPAVAGLTGRLSFSMDQTGAIHFLAGSTVVANPVTPRVTDAPQE